MELGEAESQNSEVRGDTKSSLSPRSLLGQQL